MTQWGEDPIWQSERLQPMPSDASFPDAVIVDRALPLEATVIEKGKPVSRTVDIAAHKVAFDRDRQLWYCDLTVNTNSTTYMPFVRLALVRYQPYALPEVKVSRVVLTDFAQLTPERAATITADPYQPGQLQLTLSGSAASRSEQVQANFVLVTLQEQDLTLQSDLAWRDVRTIQPDQQSTIDNLMVWVSRFSMSDLPNSTQYRLLIREYELLMSDRINSLSAQEKRLIYSETILLDEAR